MSHQFLRGSYARIEHVGAGFHRSVEGIARLMTPDVDTPPPADLDGEWWWVQFDNCKDLFSRFVYTETLQEMHPCVGCHIPYPEGMLKAGACDECMERAVDRMFRSKK